MRFMLLILSLFAMTAGSPGFPQQESQPEISQGEVVLVSIFNPTYPRLARAARVTGDVELKLEIRGDGSLDSAVVVRGHPLLNDAALSSARQSRFECRACDNETTSYSLIYSYQLVASPDWPCPEGSAEHVTQHRNQVTIEAEPIPMKITFSSIRIRSAKCLYLWACGTRWGGEEFYYSRVRSLKCLNLWKCGLKLREPFATCERLNRKIVD
jgi:TonB family protein